MNKKHKIIVLVLFWISTTLHAQHMVSGIVVDAQTREPLPGVHVIAQQAEQGNITDTYGRFAIAAHKQTPVTFSYMGYISQTLHAEEYELTVFLEQSRVELNQIVVSASREGEQRTDIPMAIEKLSPELIHETKPASLEQVMNKVSGVFMVNLGNEQHSMSIRQPISLKSLFLYLEDGFPIRPTGVFNHNALIETNVAAVKSIEVIKGPASSIYGSEAIGGSVNFITKSASGHPTVSTSSQGDNLGYKRVDFGAGNTFGKHGVRLDGYYASRRKGYREHSDFDKLALTLRGDYHLGNRDVLTTTASLVDYHADMAGSIDSAGFYSQQYPSRHTFTSRHVKALRVRSTLEHLWSDTGKTSFTMLYRNNTIIQNPAYRIKDDSENPLKASGEINDNSFQSFSAIVQHSQELGFWQGRWIGGLSMDYSPNSFHAKYLEVTRDEDGRYTGFSLADSLLTHYRVGLLNTAAYAQLDLNPLKRLRLVLALRYDRFDYHYDNFLASNAFSGAPDSKDVFQNLSPKFGFTYDFGKQRGIYGNYSVGFVPPQISDLYRGVKVPVLSPSVYQNMELGGWFAFFQKGYLDVSFYRMQGTNEVISVLLDDGTRENRNAGRTLHSGIEYGIRYNPFRSVSFRLGGTNARHKYVSYSEQGEDYNGHRMEGAPGWIANAEISFYPGFLTGTYISLEWQHVDPYFMNALNTEKYEGFDILKLRTGYQLKGFSASFHILNLADVLYATNASKSSYGKDYAPGDPRTISVGLGYNFSKNH